MLVRWQMAQGQCGETVSFYSYFKEIQMHEGPKGFSWSLIFEDAPRQPWLQSFKNKPLHHSVVFCEARVAISRAAGKGSKDFARAGALNCSHQGSLPWKFFCLWVPSMKLYNMAPENGWLEDDCLLFGFRPHFQVPTVSFGEGICVVRCAMTWRKLISNWVSMNVLKSFLKSRWPQIFKRFRLQPLPVG